MKKTEVTASNTGNNNWVIKINDPMGISSETAIEVADAVAKVLASSVDSNVLLYINSVGGSVFAATEIDNELSKIKNLSIEIGALAASAATYIIASAKTRGVKLIKARPSTKFMIHKPSAGVHGREDEIESSLALLKSLTEDYKNTYASAFEKTPEEIDQLWSQGDKWLTASEALNLGLITQVSGAEALTYADIEMIKACGFAGELKPTQTISQMNREELIKLLGLPSDATDEQITQEVERLKSLEGQNDSDAVETAAKAMLAAYRSAKKITTEQEKELLPFAKSDMAACQKMLDTFPAAESHSKHVENDPGDPRSKWTFEDYQEKDPKAFEQLQKDNPTKAQSLIDAYYNS